MNFITEKCLICYFGFYAYILLLLLLLNIMFKTVPNNRNTHFLDNLFWS